MRRHPGTAAREGTMQRTPIVTLCLLAGVLAAGLVPHPAAAQDQPAGIRLVGPYNVQRPLLAVRPFAGPDAAREAVDSVTRIVQRDLRYSSRYNILETVPQQLHADPVAYSAWNALDVVYLVVGELTPAARGYTLQLAAHDVVYSRLINQRAFALPSATDPDFRMAVHAVADEIVRWTLNQPGAAATRIAVTRQNGGGSYDLLLVDSDGFGMRRIAGTGTQLYSPVWSPDGRRILYASNTERGWQLIERDVQSGSQRSVNPGGDQLLTPAYAPDGRRIALAAWRGDGAQIFEYDLAQQCCLRPLTGTGRTISMNPVYSTDGRQIAFNSDRAGNPAIYIMSADGGGTPTQLSPFSRGSYYTSPAWSPTGSKVAFHGRWNVQMRGSFQIMVADAARPGAQIEQITARGNNEDPSWGPDGRHLVYTSVGDGPPGLYIIDVETKTKRLLASGGNLRMAEWSPILLRAADLAADRQ
jgi:TolB protein